MSPLLTHTHTQVVCLWTCCIKVIIWRAQQEKRPRTRSLFLCLLPPGLSWLPPLPVSLCGSAQFNSGNGDGCRWREQVLNVRPKWKLLFQWDKGSWKPPVLFNAAMLTLKLYFHPHPYVNLGRGVFFYYFCCFNDPINYNVLSCFNTLHMNVSWSKDADSSAVWWSDEQVMFCFQALLALPECVNWLRWCCKRPHTVRQQHARTIHSI